MSVRLHTTWKHDVKVKESNLTYIIMHTSSFKLCNPDRWLILIGGYYTNNAEQNETTKVIIYDNICC